MTKFDEGKFAGGSQAGAVNVPQMVDRPVSKEDIEKIFSLDAVYANKFYITMQQDGTIRLCFADIDPSGTFMTPRFTVVMTINAFGSFAQLIGDNVQNLAKMQRAASGFQGQIPNLPSAEKAN